ncbi:hypothetical protein EA462_07225 [Natrarchaeobius halalkaliphilus]|uniref:Uncharacterized protein n=1 Tax=Natrarchaeobius halalkaliphilus TaxID=1679091 RepID=A0A3N6LLF3_9EURY|nr:hypothetical protein [Natrarchaeobius halalkaliphilus]RQG89803.1 hypothetical protein EA462_07225 [Natrarchaeobius halalkaliphilus]
MVPTTQGSVLQHRTRAVLDVGRRITVNRLVGEIILGLWALQLVAIGLGYVFITASVEDSLAFEVVQFIWFVFTYLPASIFSILVLNPIMDQTFYQTASALGPSGSAGLFVVSLTVMYAVIGIAVSLFTLSGKNALQTVSEWWSS